MEGLLLKSLSKTEEMIRNIIEIELGYINTNHPDFIDVISLVKNDGKKDKEEFNNLSFDSVSQRDHE
jgi:dynamin 1-like protein